MSEELTKQTDFIILDKKIIHSGMIHKLTASGGDMVLEKNYGIRIVPKDKWVEVQILCYSEQPNFKLNFAYNKPVAKSEKEVEKETQLKITGETNIFEGV